MKTNLTLEIENKLINKFKNTSYRYAKEVGFGDGIVDFITAKTGRYSFHEFTCYEIKVSFSDFKSPHGHNFFGDYNYYVLTQEVYDEILDKNPNLLWGNMGIMVYKNGSFYTKRESNLNMLPISIENRFTLIDHILMNWIRGNMINDDVVSKRKYDKVVEERNFYRKFFNKHTNVNHVIERNDE